MTEKSGSYLIPKNPVSCEQTIKQSKFICHLGHAGSKDHITAELDKLAAHHPKANHVCWAYIAGHPGSPDRGMSDDGEPKGTAGRPMLALLEHSGFGEIWVAVIRYFGGIKLGKGGLIRAYTSSVQQALTLLESTVKQPMLQFRLRLDYNFLPLCKPLLDESDAQITGRTFTEQVILDLQVPESAYETFAKKVMAMSSGKARFEIND